MSGILTQFKDLIHSRDEWIRFVRFGVVGLSGVVVNQGLLYVLFEYVQLPFYLCSFIAIEVSIFTNFLLNDNWTWRSRRSGRFFMRFLRYNASAAFSSIFITITALQFFKEWVGIPYLYANLLGIGFGMLSNFLINSLWTYGELRFHFSRPVLWILFLSLASRILIAALTGAGFDEAYYYAYSIRPSLSYFDHPPFVGFLSGFFPYLLDLANAFTIRLGAIALFTASGLLFYKFARTILDESSAVLAYGLFNFIPLFFLLTGTMILPDSGLVFFWILALFPLRRIFMHESGIRFWVFAGLMTGFAMLSKYHGILLGFSLFITLVLYRPRTFLTAGPYLYALSALIPFLPVILWNVQHDFISFTFQGNRASGNGLSLLSFLQALGGQAAYLTPMVFIPVLVVIWQTIRKGLVQKDRDQQFYFLFGSVPVLLFLLVSFFSPILPHWTLPGYILLILPLAVMLKRGLEQHRWVRITLRLSVVLVLALIILALGHIRWGLLQKGIDARTDVSLDLAGWEAIPEFLEEQNLSADDWFLFSHKWFLSGEIDLAIQGQYDVRCYSKNDPRGYGIWDEKSDPVGRNGIFICSDRYFQDPSSAFGAYFQSISPPDSVVIRRGNIPAKTIYFYKCTNQLEPFPSVFGH